MSAYCIAGTYVADAAAAALPVQVARSLAAYRHHLGQSPATQLIPVARHGANVDWATLWQTFSQLVLDKSPALVVYQGSLGDAVTPETSAASWARDWQMPLLLLVPADDAEVAIAQATAFIGLARHEKASVAGTILWGTASPKEAAANELTERLQTLTQVPVVGFWLARSPDEGEASAVADLDWERLRL